MGLVLESPVWLGLLALIAAPVWLWYRDASRWKWSSLALRGLAVTALAIAAAEPVWLDGLRGSERVWVSGSQTAEGVDGDADWVVFAGAGDRGLQRLSDGVRWSMDGEHASAGEPDRTGGWLDLAAALQPPLGGREVVIADRADLDVGGAGALAAARLNAQAIGLARDPDGTPDRVRAVRCEWLGNPLPGARVGLRVWVRGVEPGVAAAHRVSVTVDAASEQTDVIDMDRAAPLDGRGRATLPVELPAEPGPIAVSLTVYGADGEVVDRRQIGLRVREPARVVVLPGTGAEVTAGTLQRLFGPTGTVRIGGMDTAADADLIVAPDTASASTEAQAALAQAVASSAGLLVLTGEASLPQPGEPLAAVIPARERPEAMKRDPSVAVVVIIDTSGSMGGPRMPLAKQVAQLAIRRLRPHDRVGIVEFYGSRRWAAPIQSAANQIEVQRGLNRLTAGGGTVILPAIQEAYYGLLNTRARHKHVLILTDGGVETGPFREWMERLRASNVAVSTVLVGPAQHSDFLMSLAQWGGGRHYHAPDKFQLPEVIFKQTEQQRLALMDGESVEVAFAPLWPDGMQDPGGGADGPRAMVSGLRRLEPRATALLPAMARSGVGAAYQWRWGRGTAAVWAGAMDDDALGEALADPGFVEWMRAWLTSLADAKIRAGSGLRIAAESVDQGLVVDLVALADPVDTNAPVRLTVRDASDQVVASAMADPVGEDAWTARVLTHAQGLLTVTASGADLAGESAVWRGEQSLPTEPGRDVANPEAGVGLAPQPVDYADAEAIRAGWYARPLTWWFVALGLILATADLLMRRLPRDGRGRGEVGKGFRGAALSTLIGTVGLLATSPSSAHPGDAFEAGESDSLAVLRAPLDKLSPGVSLMDWAMDAARDHLVNDLTADATEPAPEAGLIEIDAAGRLDLAFTAAVADEQGDSARCIAAIHALRRRGADDPLMLAVLARHLEAQGSLPAADAALSKAAAAADRRGLHDVAFTLRLRREALALDFNGNADRRDDGKRPDVGGMARLMEDEAPPAWRRAWGHYLGLTGRRDECVAALSGLAASEPFDEMVTAEHERALGRYASASRRIAAVSDQTDGAEAEAATLLAVRVAWASGETEALIERWRHEAAEGVDEGRASPLPTYRLYPMLAMLDARGETDRLLNVIELSLAGATRVSEQDAANLRQELVEAAQRSPVALTMIEQRARPEMGEIEPFWAAVLARLYAIAGRLGEAQSLLEAMLDRAEDEASALRVAEVAASLGMTSLAERAGRQAQSTGGVRARAWLSAYLHQQGRAGEAAAVLREAEHPDLSASRARALADNYSAIGRGDLAIRWLRHWLERREDVALREHLAWLLEQQGDVGSALAVWRALWRSDNAGAASARAQERLLTLSAKLGSLGDLAIETEEALAADRAGWAEVRLLVELYLRIDDPVSASEVLFVYGEQSGERLRVQRELGKLYLRTGRLALADRVLGELVEMDPANAADYLQERAVLAVERGQLNEALAAVERMRQRTDDGGPLDEFEAGLRSLLGDHAAAARMYRRQLLVEPGAVEAWLLWAEAMRGVDRSEAACARLLKLAEEAEADDAFVAAIDGLLNLDAPPSYLRAALRRAVIRAAKRPGRLYLYRVVVELADRLDMADYSLAVMNTMLLAGADRADTLLREAAERSRSLGRTDRVAEFSDLLAATGRAAPPRFLIEVGDTMLRAGRDDAADRVLRRAVRFGEAREVLPRVAERYERGLMPDRAEALLSELELGGAPEPAHLYQLASVRLQLEQRERARDALLAAIDQLLSAMPLERAAGAPLPELMTTRRRRVAGDLGQAERLFAPCVETLVFLTRDPASRDALLDAMRQRVADIAATTRQAAGDASAGHARVFPRWRRAASMLRFVALCLNRPEACADADAILVQATDEPEAVAREIAEMHERFRPGADVPDAVAAALKVEPDALEASLVTSALRDAEAAVLLNDMDAAADRFEAALAAALSTRDDAAADSRDDANRRLTQLSRLLHLAVAMNRFEDAQRIAQAAWREGPAGSPDTYAAVADQMGSMAWHLLTPEDRRKLLEALLDGFEQRPSLETAAMALKLARWIAPLDDANLAPRLTDLRESTLDLIGRGATAEAGQDGIGRVVEAAIELGINSDGTAAALADGWRASDQSIRWALLTGLAAGLPEPLSESSASVLIPISERTSPPSIDSFRPYVVLSRGGWLDHRAGAPIAEALTRRLLRDRPDDPAMMTLAARALRTNGDPRGASRLAVGALRMLASEAELNSARLGLADTAARLVKAPEASAWRDEVRAAAALQLATNHTLLMAAMACAGAGLEHDAAALARDAFEQEPTDPAVREWLVTFLDRTGRTVTLVELFWPRRNDPAVVQNREVRAMTDALRTLGAPRAALDIAARDERAFAVIETLPLRSQLGQSDPVRLRLLQHLAHNRLERQFYTARLPVPSNTGGIAGLTQLRERLAEDRATLWSALADQPYAPGVYLDLLRTASPDRLDVAGLVEGIAEAASHGEQGNEPLRERLNAASNDPPGVIDGLLMLAVARHSPEQAAEWRDAIVRWAAAYVDGPARKRLADVAELLAGIGSHADPLDRWFLSRALAGDPGASVEPWHDGADVSALLATTDPGLVDGMGVGPLAPVRQAHARVLLAAADRGHDEAARRWIEQGELRLSGLPSGRQPASLQRSLAAAAAVFDDPQGNTTCETRFADLLERTVIRDHAAAPDRTLPAWLFADRPQAARRAGDALLNRLRDPDQLVAGGDEERFALICMTAQWADRLGLDDLRDDALQAARDRLGDRADRHWLYYADAVAASDPAEATRVTAALLAEQVLPPARLENTTAALREAGRGEEARRLAEPYRTWRSLPPLNADNDKLDPKSDN